MKRTFALILMITLILSLVACNSNTVNDNSSKSDSSIEENITSIDNTHNASSSNDVEESASYIESVQTSEKPAVQSELIESVISSEQEHKHNYTSKITQNATCVAEGIKVYTCTCGSTYTENIATLGHKWGSWTVISEPTIYSEGNSGRQCSVCKYVENKLISRLPTESIITITDVQIKVIKDNFLQLVNAERTRLGLLPLNPNDHLDYAAKIRSNEIIGSFSHTRPNGESCFSVIDLSIYPMLTGGENIVMTTHLGDGSTGYSGEWTGSDSDLEAVAAWMFKLFKESKDHYKNMINAEYKDCGYGISYIIDKEAQIPVFYGVHLFGAK